MKFLNIIILKCIQTAKIFQWEIMMKIIILKSGFLSKKNKYMKKGKYLGSVSRVEDKGITIEK